VRRAETWSELRLCPSPGVSVAVSPQVSVLSLLVDAVAARRRGLPERWRRRIRESVGAEGRQACRPLGAPGHSVAPDTIVPLPPAADASVDSQIAWLLDMRPDALLDDMEQAYGPERVPEHWRWAAERPRRWLNGYASAVSDVWSAVRPLWERAQPLLDREVERVGTAVVRGALDALLGTLSERIRYADGSLLMSDQEPARYDLGRRRLVLVPMLSGPDATILNLDLPGYVWIAYPLPRADALWLGADPARRGADELASMLGPARAGLLSSLARPATMGQLATLAGTVPSAITYHCDRLEAAGLICRERRGREVWILRTRRGHEIIDLFSR
jgi:DNA-binding transcriptional ArsR family regulator